jgi:hypothetical protein
MAHSNKLIRLTGEWPRKMIHDFEIGETLTHFL